MVQVGAMWSFGYKNLENRGFVLHPHSTTLTVIRLVVPGTLIGTPVVSTTRSPAFTKPASGVYAYRQTACPIPLFDYGCCRAGLGWGGYAISAGMDCMPGVRGEMRSPLLGQQFLRTSGSGLIRLKDRSLLPCSLIFVWL